MSTIVYPLAPIVNSVNVTFPSGSQTKAVEIDNLTPNVIQINFSGQFGQSYMKPYTTKYVNVPGFGNGNIQINVEATMAGSGQAPLNLIGVVSYGVEDPDRPDGVISYGFLSAISNGTTVMAVASKVINDGNATNTPVVEATPGANGSSSVLLTNDGKLTLGDSINQNGNIQVNGTVAVSGVMNPQNNLVVGGSITSQGDHIIVTGKIGKVASGDIIDAGGLDTFIKGTNSVRLQAPNGTTDATLTNTGLVINNGTLTLNGQRITAVKGFNGSSTSTITHGMGGTPNQVIVTPNTNAVCWVTSVTSTQFTINTSVATGWFAVAFIF